MQGRRPLAIELVRQLVPGATSLEILTDDETPFLSLAFADRNVPVELAGDGTHALVRLALELAIPPRGLALLEEPEVHLHPAGVQLSARAILEAVRRGLSSLSCAVWTAPDPQGPGLPCKNTLERLVCAALVAAYPQRAKPIQQWLESRAEAPDAGPKEFAWSHMAGWYADQGCEAFYRVLWSDAEVTKQLETRMAQIGAWDFVRRLVQ